MLAALTHRGLVRPTNQDATFARDLPGGGAALAVADGVGGYPGGERASALAIAAFAAVLDAAPAGAPASELLVAAARDADRRVRAEQRGIEARMATTLVTAVVRDGAAWVANVGDSRAYHHGPAGLAQITADHSWVEEEIRAGRLRADDPLVESRRHLVTRVIGGGADAEADLSGPLALARGDALLLCSDGLHGYVPDEAIAAALAGGTGDAAEAAERLLALALERGGIDNVAVALFVRG